LSINFLIFGDVNNAPRHWVNSLQGYIIKDLNHVYFACQRPHYWIEDQTLFFDNEPNKALWNSKYNGILLSLLEDINCQRIMSNGWTSHLVYGHCWLDCQWWGQLVSIMKSLSNIQSLG
jgi:hypothetical protein